MNEASLQLIYNHFSQLSETDQKEIEAVKAKDERWETGMINHIMNEAKKILKGESGAVEDSIVYNWAFDYFHDYENLKNEKVEIPKAKPAQEIKAEPKPIEKPKKEPKKKDYEEISLLDL